MLTFPVRRAVPGTGFAGLASPGLLRWLRGNLGGADLLHVHLTRDLLTLPAAAMARRRGIPYVVQPHGQVDPSSHPLARLIDRVATRSVLRDAAAVLTLTPEEERGLHALDAGPLRLHHLGNGVPVAPDSPMPTGRPEVLFLGRLAPRKRPVLFAQMAADLLSAGVDASFALVGPDEGEGPGVQAVVDRVGDPQRLRWEGPADPRATSARLAKATLVVLPSVDEPYPMSVLESLAVGRAVVVTDTCGLAPMVREEGCGRVVDASPEALEAAVREWLADPQEQARSSARALAVARGRFSMEAVAGQLEDVYAEAVSASDRAKQR
jgi:glycosyltransferase involved in cell wall biosynthesis